MTWKAWDYQEELAAQALGIIKEHALVYLAMEERTGKCVTSMIVAENSSAARVVVLSTVKALAGWEKAIANFPHLCSYDLMNYHSAHKLKGKYDIAILDEPQNYLPGYPKRSGIWKNVHKLVYGLPIIYSSATPYAQGPQMLYNQLALSAWSPWADYKDYYAWFQKYAERDKAGNFKTIYLGPNRKAIDYKAVNAERVLKDVKHLFITKTRKELGFEHEPEDVLHYIDLTESTKNVYNIILKDNVLEFTHRTNGNDYLLVCDSPIKLRTALHMLEGGGLKIDDEYVVLGNREKIDYIHKTWGDSKDVVVMYQYIVEKLKLEAEFKHITLLQAQSFAEGVDLSGYKHLVVYSQNFSTAKHTQRRARQANMERKEEIKVHFLLVKKAISEQVYKTCSINKVNFVDSTFEREEL